MKKLILLIIVITISLSSKTQTNTITTNISFNQDIVIESDEWWHFDGASIQMFTNIKILIKDGGKLTWFCVNF